MEKKNAGVLYSNETLEEGIVTLESEGQVRSVSEGVDGKHEGIRLKKELEARHVSMIAIGGSLGTGLLIGTGSSLASAGPVSILISYSFVGLLVYTVMSCLGEMAAFIPLDGFTSYASRYVDPAVGFAVGYSYLFKYFIVTPNQLTAGAMVMQFWVSRDRVNPGVWITIFLALIVLINTVGVRFFGEFEFWLSSVKVLVMLGLILLLFIIMLGGGPNHDRTGFRFWRDPGAFKPYSEAISGSKGKFVSFASVFALALFAYTGTELCGIVAAEAKNPRRSVPRAIKLTLYRIVVFYVITILLLGMTVAYNDPRLLKAKKMATSAAASPFVVAIENASIPVLPHIFNVCVLVFVFSACNSDLYVASRSLYGLAIDGKAPRIFATTNKWGVPYYSLGLSVLFCLLAYMNVSSGSAQVFNYFVNVVSIFGLLSWITILITYIRFDKAIRVQFGDKSSLSYTAAFQPWSTYVALFFCCLIGLIKNYTVFLGHKFDYKTFISGYIGIPVYLICYVGYKVVYRTKLIKPEDVDLYTFKDAIDAEEEEYKLLEKERLENMENSPKNFKWFYETFLGWIF